MRKLLLSLALSGTFLSAMAAENATYYGVNAGLSDVEAQDKVGMGISANIGYQFNKYMGLEVNYAYFSEQNLYGTVTPATPQISGSSSFFMGAVKGMLPINDMFGLYAKIGAGASYASLSGEAAAFANGNSTAWTPATMIGGGAEWKLSDNFGIVLEDMVYVASSTNGLGNSNLLSLGVNFRF